MTWMSPRPSAAPLALAALAAVGSLSPGCVPARPGPEARAKAAPRDIPPSRVTLMLLESRDSDFDLAPDTFVVDVVLFNEFESPLPVRPAGDMEFFLLDAEGAKLATWNVDHDMLQRVQRRTALGLEGYRLTLSLRAAGVEDDLPAQAAVLQARFIPLSEGAPATGATPIRLGLS